MPETPPYAPLAKTYPREKNRVWGKNPSRQKFAYEIGPQALELHRENPPTTTKSASGVIYYGFRYYSPQSGRWLSRDPIGERGGVNLYGMVGSDLVNDWDYLGLRVGGGGSVVVPRAPQRNGVQTPNGGSNQPYAPPAPHAPTQPLPELNSEKGKPGIGSDWAEKNEEECKQLKDSYEGFKKDQNKMGQENPGGWKKLKIPEDCEKLKEWIDVARNELGSRRSHFKGNCDRHSGNSNKSYDDRRKGHEGRIRDLTNQINNMETALACCP